MRQAGIAAGRRLLADRPVQVLIGILLAGTMVREVLLYEWRPALLGYADSLPYVGNSKGHFFQDPLRPPGYPLFLWFVRGLNNSLTTTTLVQHALGLAAAIALYAAMRRVSDNRWLPLVPAAVLALHGTQIWLEQSILTEAVFTPAMVGVLLLTLVTLDERLPARVRTWTGPGAGVLLGYAVMVRPPTLAMIPIFAVVLLLVAPADAWRDRARLGAPLIGAAVVLVALAFVWAHQQTGLYSLSRSADLTIYGRVAPWADCTKFTPPKGTRPLCVTQPKKDRLGTNAWLYNDTSPLTKLYGPLYTDSRPKDASTKVREFVEQAVLHQPGDYLNAVFKDLQRVVDPNVLANPNPVVGNAGYGEGTGQLQTQLLDPANEKLAFTAISTTYSTHGTNHGPMAFSKWYERVTRLTGLPLVALLVLALVAPFVQPRGRQRCGAALFSATGFTIILVPILTLNYEWRYVVPSLSFLAAASALSLPPIYHAGVRTFKLGT